MRSNLAASLRAVLERLPSQFLLYAEWAHRVPLLLLDRSNLCDFGEGRPCRLVGIQPLLLLLVKGQAVLVGQASAGFGSITRAALEHFPARLEFVQAREAGKSPAPGVTSIAVGQFPDDPAIVKLPEDTAIGKLLDDASFGTLSEKAAVRGLHDGMAIRKPQENDASPQLLDDTAERQGCWGRNW